MREIELPWLVMHLMLVRAYAELRLVTVPRAGGGRT